MKNILFDTSTIKKQILALEGVLQIERLKRSRDKLKNQHKSNK